MGKCRPPPQIPEALGAPVKRDAEKWWSVIKELAIKPETSLQCAQIKDKGSPFDPCFPVSQSTINPWAGVKLARWWLI